jgi:hypothetical protein
MSTTQRKILFEAPKFRLFYCRGDRKKGLIPDNRKGRQWALAQGATHFGALSFNRPDGNGLPPAWRWGDFYFRLSDQQRSLRQIKAALEYAVYRILRIDPASVKATYLGPQAVGITLPATFFENTPEMPTRLDHYSALARILKGWVEGNNSKAPHPNRTGLRFHYHSLMDADNHALPCGGYAVPMPLNEFLIMSEGDLISRSTKPCDIGEFGYGRSTSPYILTMVHDEARRTPPCPTPPQSDWLPHIPLVAPNGTSTCAIHHSFDGVKCAIKLVTWCRNKGVNEFRQRNVLRAFDGSFTLDDGISEALGILLSQGHLRECLFPNYSYPGRRPRWFVVNPSVFSTPSPQ